MYLSFRRMEQDGDASYVVRANRTCSLKHLWARGSLSQPLRVDAGESIFPGKWAYSKRPTHSPPRAEAGTSSRVSTGTLFSSFKSETLDDVSTFRGGTRKRKKLRPREVDSE